MRCSRRNPRLHVHTCPIQWNERIKMAPIHIVIFEKLWIFRAKSEQPPYTLINSYFHSKRLKRDSVLYRLRFLNNHNTNIIDKITSKPRVQRKFFEKLTPLAMNTGRKIHPSTWSNIRACKRMKQTSINLPVLCFCNKRLQYIAL